MINLSTHFSIAKKVLSNGLTVLVKPVNHIPRVEAHLWYNIGSKHENVNEKGMAHLMEHMLFKGTKNLSETDINLITHKLAGYSNAFTSHDYTAYVFRLPSNTWHHALGVFAECMETARFDPQMLASEVKTVIEELRLYNDDYQNAVIEALMAAIFPEHPYHYPVIGSKYDLAKLDRETLFAFYKKYYHPKNATLVVVGDVKAEDVFELAEQAFSHLTSPHEPVSSEFYFDHNLARKTVTLYRQVTTPWACSFYSVPGMREGKQHISDIASLILGGGKSSRLYKRLVEQDKLVSDIDSFSFDFFEITLFGIAFYPFNISDIAKIESIIDEEITKLATMPIAEWEFTAARKKTALDYSSLLESYEKQANLIGSYVLATGDEKGIETYLENLMSLDPLELQLFFKTYCSPLIKHAGYLLPLPEAELPRLEKLQRESDDLEQIILEKHVRTSPVEDGKLVNSLGFIPLSDFSYPKPEEFILDNGLQLIIHNNPLVSHVSCILSFKGGPLYDVNGKEGAFNFLLRLLTDRTAKRSSQDFHTFLETAGIMLAASTETIGIKCLSDDLTQALLIFKELLTEPSFDNETIEKIKQQLYSEISEFWDNPTDFIDQIAKMHIYQNHPYGKNIVGTQESIKALSISNLQSSFKQMISPREAILVVVGNIANFDIPSMVEQALGSWQGATVATITYPPVPEAHAQIISHPINRDQVVLAFAAPTISRTDEQYLSLALLDIILTGGSTGSAHSRLFQLREQTGLFYAIGGSLLYNAREEPGMMFIKTIISADKTQNAQELIIQTIQNVQENGITEDEFVMAKNLLLSSLVEAFETNTHMANTFLFLKKYNLSFNLFDKQVALLSILKIEEVNEVARKFCDPRNISTIRIGRLT